MPGERDVRRGSRESWTGFLMALPALLGLVLFVALPFCVAVALSFAELRLGSPHGARYIGLANYAEILGDPVFTSALRNTGLFALVVVPVQTVLALGLALLLDRRLPGLTLFRSLFFLPVLFPMSLVSVIWQLLYAPGPDGALNSLVAALSFGSFEPVDWLRDERFALPALMLLSIWQGVGFQMLILLAGLQGIPGTRYEAARIDGASAWERFWHVTLPGLKRPLLFVVLVTSILSFRLFDQVRILTQGGPEESTTSVMFETVRRAFDRGQIGIASAMTAVFFVLVLLVTLLQRLAARERRAS